MRGGGILREGAPPPPRGGILGGEGIGPGGREGIFAMGNNMPGSGGPQRPTKKDRIRMGPIVFDAEHLQHDDNDDYSDSEEEDAYQRPKLGLDLSNLFIPLINFLKLTGKSFEALFMILEKQICMLLGRNVGHGGSISVTIVIIISWLVIALVVYALAQFAILRSLNEEEEEELLENEENALELDVSSPKLLILPSPPTLQTTPPTPGSWEQEVEPVPVKPIWLPSVGSLNLSESSILRRRESRKRKKKVCASVDPTCQRIRHRSCDVDPKTLAWLEAGLDRIQDDTKVRSVALLKWNAFLKQHLLLDLVKDELTIKFSNLQKSELPKLANIDVEMSDEESLVRKSIQHFEAWSCFYCLRL